MEIKRHQTNVNSLKAMYPLVWNMTSKEFHDDPDARLDFIMSRIKDKVTLSSFQRAFCYNRHLFVGRTVLVLNCGVDFVLTLWASKTGAAHVYGVDTSQAIKYLERIIYDNNIRNISLVQGRVEDIELPVKDVDIIISNWMGYSLLFDSKLEDLIYARDKWLNKGTGIIFPDWADLYLVGIENSKSKNQHIDWWRDVHGFNMSAIRKLALNEPCYQTVDTREILTDPVKVWSVNLYKVSTEELHFRTPFTIVMKRCGGFEGMLTFFDVQFSKSHTPMGFSTSPITGKTNWLQTVFYFDDPVHVNLGDRLFCGILIRPKFDEFKTKFYSIVIEVFSGILPNISQVVSMAYYKKSQYSACKDVIKPVNLEEKTENEVQDNVIDSQKSENQPTKGKQKREKKKKRMTRKISTDILFIE